MWQFERGVQETRNQIPAHWPQAQQDFRQHAGIQVHLLKLASVNLNIHDLYFYDLIWCIKCVILCMYIYTLYNNITLQWNVKRFTSFFSSSMFQWSSKGHPHGQTASSGNSDPGGFRRSSTPGGPDPWGCYGLCFGHPNIPTSQCVIIIFPIGMFQVAIFGVFLWGIHHFFGGRGPAWYRGCWWFHGYHSWCTALPWQDLAGGSPSQLQALESRLEDAAVDEPPSIAK